MSGLRVPEMQRRRVFGHQAGRSEHHFKLDPDFTQHRAPQLGVATQDSLGAPPCLLPVSPAILVIDFHDLN